MSDDIDPMIFETPRGTRYTGFPVHKCNLPPKAKEPTVRAKRPRTIRLCTLDRIINITIALAVVALTAAIGVVGYIGVVAINNYAKNSGFEERISALERASANSADNFEHRARGR